MEEARQRAIGDGEKAFIYPFAPREVQAVLREYQGKAGIFFRLVDGRVFCDAGIAETS